VLFCRRVAIQILSSRHRLRQLQLVGIALLRPSYVQLGMAEDAGGIFGGDGFLFTPTAIPVAKMADHDPPYRPIRVTRCEAQAAAD
jgi:hypothetical protein